ncbi:MFS transporter [Streptomyces sp. NPDC047000]|uniref:MFS transporter n=1 Tax=Streptomyces sp. NPDC047000 TaxID=3155474 RepID=UPI0033E7F772
MSNPKLMSAPMPTAQWGRVGVVLGGQGVSLIGDQVFFVAALWVAAQLGGTSAVTWVTLAESVPRALALLFGGVICDAIGPRLVLLRTTSVRVAVLAVATVATLFVRSVPLLAVVATLEGAMLGLGAPSYGTLLPRMVSDNRLDTANSVRTMVARFAPILGSPFGAWLVATGRLTLSFAVVCGGCVVSLLSLVPVTRSLAPVTTHATGLARRAADGFRLLRTDRRLRLLFLSALCLDFAFAWPLNPGLPVVVLDRGWHVSAVGLLTACWAAGALVSAAAGAMLGNRVPLAVRLIGGGVGIWVMLTCMILVRSPAAMATIATLLGVCSGQNGPAGFTLYQQSAPRDQLGVATALMLLAAIGCGPLAYAVFGLVANLTGPTVAWLCSASLALGGPVAAGLALCVPSVDRA